MGRPLVLALVLLGACKETGVLKEIEDPREYDGFFDSDPPVNDEELPTWPGGRPPPGTHVDTDGGWWQPPHTGLWRPKPYPDTGRAPADTDPGGPDTDPGGPDTDPGGPDTDRPGEDTDTDTDTPYDTDRPGDPGDPGDTDRPGDPGDTDRPGDPGDTDRPGDPGDTDRPGDSDTNLPPTDETGLWVPDTDGTPPVLTPAACRKAASIAGFLDRFQVPGDGKVQFCHRSAEGKWVTVNASTSACLAHASHLLDIFPTTLCDH